MLREKNRFNRTTLFFLLTISLSFSQVTPFFKNHNLNDAKIGNQNWSCHRGDSGRVYVANNSGLLVFDGMEWELFPLPNKTVVRSVLADGDRIYTGSYSEFGYWKPDRFGKLTYHSLNHLMQDKPETNEEFWEITKFQDGIYFRSFGSVYVLKDGKINRLSLGYPVISLAKVDRELLVVTLNGGVFKVADNDLTPFIGPDIITDLKIITLSKLNGKFFILTALNGCFYLEKDRLVPFEGEIQSVLKQQQLNCFETTQDGKMIFGTIKDGIYVCDDQGNILYHLNRENGLINNTVLNLYLDEFSTLWAGLDHGVNSIDLESAHFIYNDISGKLGTVYDVISHNNRIYLGSNTGLYKINDEKQLQFLEGSQGQVWDLFVIDDQLICSHNDGTYLVGESGLMPISNYTGAWTTKKIPGNNNDYLQGTYTGLVKLSKNQGRFMAQHLGATTMPIRFIAFENKNTIWAAHAYKGLYRIKLNQKQDSIIAIDNYESKTVFSPYNVRVYNIKNDVVFFSIDGWFKYEPLQDTIISFPLLNDKFGSESYLINDYRVDNYILKDPLGSMTVFYDEGVENTKKLDLGPLNDRLILGYEKISRLNDSIYTLNLQDGFMKIDISSIGINKTLKRPTIDWIETSSRSIDISELEKFDIAFDEALNIKLSSPLSRNHKFEYNLDYENSDQWKPIENSILKLANLRGKSYKLALRAFNTEGHKSDITQLQFKVNPPWYLSTFGYVLYTIFGILILLTFYILHLQNVGKKQKRLHFELTRRQKEALREKSIQNEKNLMRIRNQSLRNEIKLKSKQLADTAMSLVRKNETLLELKNYLQQHRSNFDNYFIFNKIIKKLDYSLDHKDEWELFEHNFNQVHEEFLKNLKARHKTLKNKDLKACAYIKMGLSNKEMASLMNISVRGVETFRYRLKKRLDLQNDINLKEYLENL